SLPPTPARYAPDLTGLAFAPAVREPVGADRTGVAAADGDLHEGLIAFDANRLAALLRRRSATVRRTFGRQPARLQIGRRQHRKLHASEVDENGHRAVRQRMTRKAQRRR